MRENRLITGRFAPGVSGNPGGRPRGLATTAREAVGKDGASIVAFWLSIMEDPGERTADRLAASKLLADRGWGAAPLLIVEDDFSPWEEQKRVDALAAEMDAELIRLERRRAEAGRE
jgi:hypothetical protein